MQTVKRLLSYLPRGNTLDDAAWGRRHRILQWLLGLWLPGLAAFGLVLGWGLLVTTVVLIPPVICLGLGHVIHKRRPASIFITAGLTYCSAALVGFTHGSIEAHFTFFIIIGFIALYQDWVPFLWNVIFTVVSHGLGSVWQSNLIFNHPAGQLSPWLWSLIHGLAVLFACIGMVIFWRANEEEQQKREVLTKQLAEAEIGRRRFTSDLLVNLARRNQSMLYRQLDIINQLEEKERDPDALSELFRLDHLATRVRRNAENLLVLSGEQPTRVWSAPVPLRDVVRAAIAETEDLERVVFAIDEKLSVAGHTVTDLTHLIAELTENAVRFSPPHASVSIRTRPYLHAPGAYLLTIEDWGVGMPMEEIAAANELFAHPPEIDLAVSQRLGFHVVARLAQRHAIGVSLTPTPGCGITAVVMLPANLFDDIPVDPQQDAPQAVPQRAANHHAADRQHQPADREHQPADLQPWPADRQPGPPDQPKQGKPNRVETAPHALPMVGTASPPPKAPIGVVAALQQAQWPAFDAGDPATRRHEESWVGWWRATTPEQVVQAEQLAAEPIRPASAPGLPPQTPAGLAGSTVPPQRSAAGPVGGRPGENGAGNRPGGNASGSRPGGNGAGSAASGPGAGNRTGGHGAGDPAGGHGTGNGHGGSSSGNGAVASERDHRDPSDRDRREPPEHPRHDLPENGQLAPAENGHREPSDRDQNAAERDGQPSSVPGQRLNRRVPQSHLAPELRSMQQQAAAETPAEHALQASQALSRYQASRHAAQHGLGPGAVDPAGNGAGGRGENGGRQ